MSSQPTDVRRHPVSAFVRHELDELAGLADVPVWSMPPEEQLDTLRDLARLQAQLSAMRLNLLAHAEAAGATTQAGAASAADWVAVETRQVRREARADLRLGQALALHPLLADACAAGRVDPAQARAIVGALDRLPVTGEHAVDDAQRIRAEEHLVALAEHHDAAALRILGAKIMEVVAPEVAEAFEGRQLEAQEARSLRRVWLSLADDGEGTSHLRARIPTLHGQMLRSMILALTSPRRTASTGVDRTGGAVDPELPLPVRHGLAFTQILEAVTDSALPRTGGVGATVVVTMTKAQLIADLDAAGVATLDTGGRISAKEARRLACGAGIVPVVLGGSSQVLDAGRRRRFHTEPMRVALAVRDGGCTAEDCDAPPGFCHAHHELPFSQGGSTSVANGRLLCGHHHRRIHDPAYAHTTLANGKVRFHRRT